MKQSISDTQSGYFVRRVESPAPSEASKAVSPRPEV